MKLISWNVNGIRAVLRKNFMEYFLNEQPDVLCIQETKAQKDQVKIELPSPFEQYWNGAERKGYAGTAVFTKVKPLNVSFGMNMPKHDKEGRVITLEFLQYYLVNAYTPNSGEGLRRLDYRQVWDKDFLKYVKKLERKKPVIFCGDLNVAHKEIDLARPDDNHFNAGFTDEERAGFDRIIESNFLDTFREVNKEPHHYTWWSYRMRAREKNIGWRIDYFCLSKSLRSKMKDAFIQSKVMGSDHCPVGLILS